MQQKYFLIKYIWKPILCNEIGYFLLIRYFNIQVIELCKK